MLCTYPLDHQTQRSGLDLDKLVNWLDGSESRSKTGASLFDVSLLRLQDSQMKKWEYLFDFHQLFFRKGAKAEGNGQRTTHSVNISLPARTDTPTKHWNFRMLTRNICAKCRSRLAVAEVAADLDVSLETSNQIALKWYQYCCFRSSLHSSFETIQF